MSIQKKLLLSVLSLCLPCMALAAPDEQWQATTLSDETLQKVQRTLVDYQQCVNDETRAHSSDRLDSRAITDIVLKKCEQRLGGVKTAFDAEKVPSDVSERYMRSRRTHAARNILKTVMGIQALQAGAGQLPVEASHNNN
jgi:hypothetical protein